MSHQATVGLDLSLTSTGIAISECGTITTHRVRSKGSKDATWEERCTRLQDLRQQIAHAIPTCSLIMIEGPSYGSIGSGTHDRSGLWWLIYSQLTMNGCTIIPVSPAQRMKYATGKGGGKDAGKDNVLAAAVKRYPNIDITGNDIADAVILMAIGCRLVGNPLEQSLPKTHADALTKLALPTTTAAA